MLEYEGPSMSSDSVEAQIQERAAAITLIGESIPLSLFWATAPEEKDGIMSIDLVNYIKKLMSPKHFIDIVQTTGMGNHNRFKTLFYNIMII